MMGPKINSRRVLVVARRVVRQLKRDRRTIGLITLAPVFLMILFGYALSGEMAGINLGVVDLGGQDALRDHLATVDDFDLLRLGSESDAERLIVEGRLHGAVVIRGEEVRVLLDGSSPQITASIMTEVKNGLLPLKGLQNGGRMDVGGELEDVEGGWLGGDGIVGGSSGPGGLGSDGDIGICAALGGYGGPGAAPEVVQRYIRGYDLEMMDSVGPAVLGLVVFFFTFITAAISFLRERTQGSLEKFMVSPLSRPEMVAGYLLGFSLFALLQSATTLLVVVLAFGVPMEGSPLTAFGVILLLGAGGLVLGAFLSNFAKTEFQVVQFIPIVILPQVVLSGVWWPLESIPAFLQPISYALPLTYSSDALRAVMLKGAGISEILVPDLLFLVGFFVLAFGAATLMLKREVG
ncbi:MAG: ABC transporter permease [Methanothrix sp.]|jgi:ABC-2 type transport system permease protein|nr:ABC transporter permease [Methanothrix sp.]OPX82242.1 MAG: ABC-2 family transporter protein [Methanosaeta sp. PtaB.Bin087]NLX40006.1 ABC transporter permease [Methanothrix sp.]HOI69519.1 ABC transporter permease [Methanothrix sp.]HPY73605.1 ABC transporter permease [Methanothrix sp.]